MRFLRHRLTKSYLQTRFEILSYVVHRLSCRNFVKRRVFKTDVNFCFSSLREFIRSWQYTSIIKEPEIYQWVADTFRDSVVFYDIGANTGGYSLGICKKSHSYKAYAFEPVPTNYNSICSNILANNLSNQLVALPFSISSKTSLNPFFIQSRVSLINSGYAQSSLSSTLRFADLSDWQSYQVPSFSLDDAIQMFKLLPPTHLKIDVDGHELSVLEGAKNALSQYVKEIIVEVQSANHTEILQLLTSVGFTQIYDESTQRSGQNIMNLRFTKID